MQGKMDRAFCFRVSNRTSHRETAKEGIIPQEYRYTCVRLPSKPAPKLSNVHSVLEASFICLKIPEELEPLPILVFVCR